jgi:hypothetical protein
MKAGAKAVVRQAGKFCDLRMYGGLGDSLSTRKLQRCERRLHNSLKVGCGFIAHR